MRDWTLSAVIENLWKFLNAQQNTNTVYQSYEMYVYNYNSPCVYYSKYDGNKDRSKMHRGSTTRSQRLFLFFIFVKPQNIPRYKSA